MIEICYTKDGEEKRITATGLGDLGWQLDSLGFDTKAADAGVVVSSVRIVADMRHNA